MDDKEVCTSCSMAFASPRAFKAHIKHHETLEREAQQEAECFMTKRDIAALRESEIQEQAAKSRRKSSTAQKKGGKIANGRGSSAKKKTPVRRGRSGVKEEPVSEDDTDSSESDSESEDSDDDECTVTKSTRGRPRLHPLKSSIKKEREDSPKRPRGRPRLKPQSEVDADVKSEPVSDADDSPAPKRLRGRPRISAVATPDSKESPSKRGRGRPRIYPESSAAKKKQSDEEEESDEEASPVAKRRRLRPRMYPESESPAAKSDKSSSVKRPQGRPAKRGRGRPRKSDNETPKVNETPKGKRPRGRPRLTPVSKESPVGSDNSSESEEEEEEEEDHEDEEEEDHEEEEEEDHEEEEEDDDLEKSDDLESKSSPKSAGSENETPKVKRPRGRQRLTSISKEAPVVCDMSDDEEANEGKGLSIEVSRDGEEQDDAKAKDDAHQASGDTAGQSEATPPGDAEVNIDTKTLSDPKASGDAEPKNDAKASGDAASQSDAKKSGDAASQSDAKASGDVKEVKPTPSSSIVVGKRQSRKPKKYIEEGEDVDVPHETFVIAPSTGTVDKIVVKKPGKPTCVVLKVRRPVGRPRQRPPDVICEKTGRTLVTPDAAYVQSVKGSLPNRGRPSNREPKLVSDAALTEIFFPHLESKDESDDQSEANGNQKDDHSYPRKSLESQLEKQIQGSSSKEVPSEEASKKVIINITPDKTAADGGSTRASDKTCKICNETLDSKEDPGSHVCVKLKESTKQTGPSTPRVIRVKAEPDDEDRNRTCLTCGKECSNLCGLKSHERSHNLLGRKQHTCHICGRQFSQLGTLRVHIRTHTGEKPFACAVCMKGFATLSSCKIHMRTHTGERPFQCDVCSLMFKQAGHLRDHARRHHDEPGRSLCMRCPICDKVLSCKSALKTHMLIHEDIRPYQCDLCGRAFRQRGHLKDHLETHNTERKKPFICDICGHGFVSAAVLHNHHLTHTGQKPFECGICGRCFRQRGHLKDHMVTHEPSGKSAAARMLSSKFISSPITPIEVESVSQEEEVPQQSRQSLILPQESRAVINTGPLFNVLSLAPGGQILTLNTDRKLDKPQQKVVVSTPVSSKPKSQTARTVQVPNVAQAKSLLQNPNSKPSRPVDAGGHCLCCNQRFLSMPELTKHVEQLHLPTTVRQCYKCSYCDTQLGTIQEVNDHLLQYHQVQSGNLLANALQKSNNFSYSCNGCDQLFNEVKLLKQHFIKQHTQNLNQSESLTQVFSPVPTAVAAPRAPSPPLAYQCPICSELSTTWDALGKHVQKHGMQIIATGAETGALLDTSAQLSTVEDTEQIVTVMEQPDLGEAMSELPGVVMDNDMDYAYVEYIGDSQVMVTEGVEQEVLTEGGNQATILVKNEDLSEVGNLASDPAAVQQTAVVQGNLGQEVTVSEVVNQDTHMTVIAQDQVEEKKLADVGGHTTEATVVMEEKVESLECVTEVENHTSESEVVVQETVEEQMTVPPLSLASQHQDGRELLIDQGIVVQETVQEEETLPDIEKQSPEHEVIKEDKVEAEDISDVDNHAADPEGVREEEVTHQENISDVGNLTSEPAVQESMEVEETVPDVGKQTAGTEILVQEVGNLENMLKEESLSDVVISTSEPAVMMQEQVGNEDNLMEVGNQTSDMVVDQPMESTVQEVGSQDIQFSTNENPEISGATSQNVEELVLTEQSAIQEDVIQDIQLSTEHESPEISDATSQNVEELVLNEQNTIHEVGSQDIQLSAVSENPDMSDTTSQNVEESVLNEQGTIHEVGSQDIQLSASVENPELSDTTSQNVEELVLTEQNTIHEVGSQDIQLSAASENPDLSDTANQKVEELVLNEQELEDQSFQTNPTNGQQESLDEKCDTKEDPAMMEQKVVISGDISVPVHWNQ